MTLKKGWIKKIIDGISTNVFAISHAKSCYYDYTNNITVYDKLNKKPETILELLNINTKYNGDVNSLSIGSFVYLEDATSVHPSYGAMTTNIGVVNAGWYRIHDINTSVNGCVINTTRLFGTQATYSSNQFISTNDIKYVIPEKDTKNIGMLISSWASNNGGLDTKYAENIKPSNSKSFSFNLNSGQACLIIAYVYGSGQQFIYMASTYSDNTSGACNKIYGTTSTNMVTVSKSGPTITCSSDNSVSWNIIRF